MFILVFPMIFQSSTSLRNQGVTFLVVPPKDDCPWIIPYHIYFIKMQQQRCLTKTFNTTIG
jgi:hypothetical protein